VDLLLPTEEDNFTKSVQHYSSLTYRNEWKDVVLKLEPRAREMVRKIVHKEASKFEWMIRAEKSKVINLMKHNKYMAYPPVATNREKGEVGKNWVRIMLNNGVWPLERWSGIE
jgi:hypothetical protein